MIDETVTINVLSQPGTVSKLTLRLSSGQHGTIALNLFAIYLGTAWTARLYVNLINRLNFFLDDPFSRECFLRIIFFLYTSIQNPRLRTVYRQRKWPLLAPVRKMMALGRKIIAIG